VCCSVLQCVVVCFSVAAYTEAVAALVRAHKLHCVAGCCSVLQCAAVCCRVLQGVAGCCRVLQGVVGLLNACENTMGAGARIQYAVWVNMSHTHIHTIIHTRPH